NPFPRWCGTHSSRTSRSLLTRRRQPQETTNSLCALLRHHAVAERLQLVVAGDVGYAGDPPIRQALHPLHETRRQSGVAVAAWFCGGRGYSSEGSFPSGDGWSVRSPLNSVTTPCRVSASLPNVFVRPPAPSPRTGVGRSFPRTIASVSVTSDAPDPPDALESIAVGVGSSCTALGSIRSPEVPRWFGPPLVPSVARGVGSRPGDDEDPEPSVRGADVGSS